MLQPTHYAGIIISLCLILIAGSLNAEIYKWKDKDGRVHMSDRAPLDQNAEKIEIKTRDTKTTTEPNREKTATKAINIPVVMYSASWCGYCKLARSYFRKNKITFKEYDIETSSKGKRDYKRLNGKSVPIILIGSRRLSGFSAGSFEQAWDQAQIK